MATPFTTEAARQPTQLQYPLWMRALSAGLINLPLSVAISVWGEGPPAEAWLNAIPWITLVAWLALTYQVFLVELYYDDSGVIYVSPLAGVVRLEWSEIVALAPVKGIDGYAIEADDGRRIVFTAWREGIEDFARAIQHRLPRQARGGR